MSGKLRLQLRPVELAPLVQDAIDAILPAAQGKGIDVQTDIGPGVNVVLVDADRIRQVMWNLLTNAVKFSPKGARISVGLWRRKSEIEIRVTDTGRGIEPEFLPHVFDRFRQADASSTRRQGGLGLGLDISRQLVELHGGVIEAHSEGTDKGSTITVHLPLRDLPQPRLLAREVSSFGTTPAAANAGLESVRILLVEDDSHTQKALSIVLQDSGALVLGAASAKAALEVYGSQAPDLIVSDIGLPDEDGCALLQRIRELEKNTGSTVPALALSAFTRDEDRQRAMQSGFQQYLGKPIDPDQLLETLKSMLTHSR